MAALRRSAPLVVYRLAHKAWRHDSSSVEKAEACARLVRASAGSGETFLRVMHHVCDEDVDAEDFVCSFLGGACHRTGRFLSQAAGQLRQRPTSARFHPAGSGWARIHAVTRARPLGLAFLLSMLLVTLLHGLTARVRAAQQGSG